MNNNIDISLLPLCSKVAEGDKTVSDQLKKHILVKKMSEGMSGISFTPEDFVNAAFSDLDDKRFSWSHFKNNYQYVSKLVDHIQQNSEKLFKKTLNNASRFLGLPINSAEIQLNLVCGGKWDAYVLVFKDTPEIFMDVGLYAKKDTTKMINDFESVLTHEMWHLAFYRHKDTVWKNNYKDHFDPNFVLIYEILNEGIGHCFSLYNHLYPTVTIIDFKKKVSDLFKLFTNKYREYISETDLKVREKLLWKSHAGVPFWEKWGALTGAIITYRLVEALGDNKVKKIIKDEPFSLIVIYQQLAKEKKWELLPNALVEQAKKGLKINRR